MASLVRGLVWFAAALVVAACSSSAPDSLAFSDEPAISVETFVQIIERDFPTAADNLGSDIAPTITTLADDICRTLEEDGDPLVLEPADVFESGRFTVFATYAGGWKCPDVTGQILRDDLNPE
jgi:hypothetical protein